jgi:hypothetical protein
MIRLLWPLLIVLPGCASLPEIRPCEPTGAVVPPTYLNLGDQDLMIASIAYTGCPEYEFFQLCGIGPDWFEPDRITLGIWHDDLTLNTCNDEVLVDELFNLGSLRRRYEKEFDVDSASLVIDISGVELDYSFQPDP